MRLDDDKNAIEVLEKLFGSQENRIRQMYNLGYKAGYTDGAKAVTDRIAEKVVLELMNSSIESKDE